MQNIFQSLSLSVLPQNHIKYTSSMIGVKFYVLIFKWEIYFLLYYLLGYWREKRWHLCSYTGDSQLLMGFPGDSSGKEDTCQCRRHKFDLWVVKIPWRMEWKPIPVFLTGKPHRGAWSSAAHGVAKSETRLSLCTLGNW